ncbi:MAG: hypothetical protein K2X66_07680 [Cyanobacteria bacterium]|nr:hypothetical protein [Cyanobacteriota bacterium]
MFTPVNSLDIQKPLPSKSFAPRSLSFTGAASNYMLYTHDAPQTEVGVFFKAVEQLKHTFLPGLGVKASKEKGVDSWDNRDWLIQNTSTPSLNDDFSLNFWA